MDRGALLYCDGASSGNPGKSGIGIVLISGETTYEMSEYIGIATNNIAEYKAFIRGISKAKSLGIKKISIFLDSELLVNQIKGTYKVKNEKLRELYNIAVTFLKSFKDFSITHVPREKNKKADSLARNAIKSAVRNDPIPG